MNSMLTEFAMVSIEPGKPAKPAICAWLDADIDEKKALLDYLYKFGALGRSAHQILLSRDPRLFTHKHPDYGGGIEEFTGDRHPQAMEKLRDKYNVGY